MNAVVLFRSYPMRNRKFQKNSKKYLKIPLWLHFKPEHVGKGREREKIHLVVPFRSYPTRNRKFQKNSKKIKKYHYGSISNHHRLKEDEKGGKEKLLFHSVPT